MDDFIKQLNNIFDSIYDVDVSPTPVTSRGNRMLCLQVHLSEKLTHEEIDLLYPIKSLLN